MLVEVLGFTNLLCAGMLAGEEFVIRYGVRAPVASLDPQPEIQLRQALIRRLRVLVPAIFGLAFFSGIAVTLLEGFGPGFGFRCVGLLALVAFISITLGGTVPINKATLTWEAAAPPELASDDQQMGTARHRADLGGGCGVRPLFGGWGAALNTALNSN